MGAGLPLGQGELRKGEFSSIYYYFEMNIALSCFFYIASYEQANLKRSGDLKVGDEPALRGINEKTDWSGT
jgi:hypothetical protein